MKKVLLIFCLLCLSLTGSAQQQLVSGKVIASKDSTALPGATVVLKGTGNGITTGTDGTFTLSGVPDKGILFVSFLGYTSREVEINTPLSQHLVIALQENSSSLQEVIVSTGYQDIPQERATGSFAQVSSARLNEQVSTDVLSRLEAVANGLTVDRGTNSGGIMIRGLSTIQGPKAPLIVVDNFPYEGDINNLNPNDIENITLLKDAAAASIWGARAGNGVIVITTKKSRYNQPLRLEFNSNVTLADAPSLAGIRQMSTSDFIDVEQMLFGRGYYNSQINSTARPALTPVIEILIQKANGTLSEQEADARINHLRQVDVRDEFSRYMYQRTLNQQYSLNLRGGSASNAWLVAGGYDRNMNELAAGYNRVNLRFQNTLRPVKNLELATGIYLTQSRRTSGKPGYGDVSMVPGRLLYPYASFADEAGTPLAVMKDYRQSFKNETGNGRLLDWNYYPLEDYRHNRTGTELRDILANFGLRYQLPLGLEADLKYQFQHQETTTESLQGEHSYGARDLVNRFTQINPASGAVTHIIPRGGILDISNGFTESHNARGQLNFNRAWDSHSFAALAGGEVRSTNITGKSNRLYGYNEDILTFGKVDYVNRYPSIINGSLAFIPDNTFVSDKLNRFVSLFGNAAYTYKGRYTLSASARQDASNLFGVRANDRWTPLWSSGLGWDISGEPFYKLAFLPFLKLRATYGFSGNVNQNLAAVTTMSYRTSLSAQTLSPTATFSNYANPELTWETAGMFNTGLDFRLKNDVLSGSLEYYRKIGTDLFGRELIDYTSGIGSSVVRNAASMKGNGFDVELNAGIVNTTSFSWTAHLNASYYKDEVTKYYLSSTRGSSFVGSVPAISGQEGKPVYGIYSYRWAGLDPSTGAPQGYLNGEASTDYAALTGPSVLLDDLTYHGSALPTYFGSVGSTVSYRNFSLTARVSYKMGYFFRRRSINYGSLFANSQGHADFANRWQQPGDEALTDVPALYYPVASVRESFYAGAETLVERGDHIRFQYVTASYELRKANWARLPFERAQTYLNVSNLGLIWTANRQGLDPDYNLSSFALPPSRAYALGFKVFF